MTGKLFLHSATISSRPLQLHMCILIYMYERYMIYIYYIMHYLAIIHFILILFEQPNRIKYFVIVILTHLQRYIIIILISSFFVLSN